ncbi:MAG TPA: response regulator transcription factor [Kofleriaceae bacterium]|jgi:two-component system response regulator MtrA|nr:response regulator transcription factor [Kofleriaceae bacterium]
MAERILVIEDDAELGAQIVERLERAGYATRWWREGREVPTEPPLDVHLVILDLMLPGTYGLDVLRALRETSEVPVLVLSARNDTTDKIRALRLGADDYMTKPFWPDELIERVRARLRRPGMQRTATVEAGPLRVDLDARAVHVDGEAIELTRVEFDLLAALARRPGVAVSRAWLVEHVLHDDRDAAVRTLDVHASRLRKKLGRPELIETVWGVGYRLAKRAP